MAGPNDDTASMCMRCTRGDLNTNKPPHIPARILWPALTFPAVIDPGNSAEADDASTCVTVLIVTPWANLTKRQASMHLRFVPWDQRHKRYLPSGTANGFTVDEIEVRLDLEKQNRVSKADEFVRHVYFGYDAKIANGFSGALSVFVLNLYKKLGYQYLHEIRISRSGSARLAAGQYNLFWVNADWTDTEQKISDEMQLLIDHYARPSRDALVATLEGNGESLENQMQYFLNEYEFDYDTLHEPYLQGKSPAADASKRTEVLHPLFVQPTLSSVKIGHVTDLHYSVRADVYEDRLKNGVIFDDHRPAHPSGQGNSTELDPPTHVDYSNWNKNSTKLYTQARQTCDILLLTGDLTDYGRGFLYLGPTYFDEQGEDVLYQTDRNWFLFYYAMASGSSYQKPVYTILGNHDWRVNPYPPFAPGAPDPRALINNDLTFTDKQLMEIVRDAHGRGFEKKFSYAYNSSEALDLALEAPGVALRSFWDFYRHHKTLNVKHFPTETTIDSVSWYLLLMNPFLDYCFHLPGGFDLLMLDWAEYEDLLFPVVNNGKEEPYGLGDAASGRASYPGPVARSCLTDFQKDMVETLLLRTGKAKVIGIHAPPVGPYTEWTDDNLYDGKAAFQSDYWPDQVFAIKPQGAEPRHEADYNSFGKNREWFIRKLHQKSANVRLVLGGHIHRNGVFVAYEGPTTDYPNATGELHTKMVHTASLQGAAPPAATLDQWGTDAPLYVNTTSAGPRGHLFAAKPRKGDPDVYVDPGYAVMELASDGTIRAFEFRTDKTVVAPPAAASASSS